MPPKAKDIVIVPQEADFKYELEEGASEVCNNEQKFEMYFDFREFVRTDIKISIAKKVMRVFALTETETEINEFDEEIAIPDRVKRETISATINKNGVLRIHAPMGADKSEATCQTVSESVKTQKKVSSGQAKTITKKTTENEQEEEEDEEEEEAPAAANAGSKHVKTTTTTVVEKTGAQKVMAKPKQAPAAAAPEEVVVTPKIAEFTVDESKIKEKPEFAPGSIKNRLEAYLKCANYKPEEIQVKINRRNSMIRIEGNHTSKLEQRSFFKEFSIPKEMMTEEIEVDINKNGILRISAPDPASKPKKRLIPEPEPKKEPEKEKAPAAQHHQTIAEARAALITPKKAKFEAPAEEVTKSQLRERPDGKTLQQYVNVSNFATEEVVVKKSKRTIQVEAKSKSQVEDFFKEIAIPDFVDEESVTCEVNEKRILRFTMTRTKTTTITTTETRVVQNESQVGEIKYIQPKITKTTTTTTQAVAAPPGAGKFEAKIIVQGYDPEELEVSIANGWITVKGKKDPRLFGERDFRSRSFTKKIQIPSYIDPESIVCPVNLTSGHLSLVSK